MGFTPNRIVLISHGRHDEAQADSDCYPGMSLLIKSNGNIIPHNVEGGAGELCIAEEDALRGGDVTQKLPSGYVLGFRRPTRGDKLLMLLQNGQNVAQRAALMNAGDGTLIAAPASGTLYEITAPSTTITNTNVETAFSNGSFNVPANYLQPGDRLRIRAKVLCLSQNSTNTHRIRLYFGTGPITIADSTALALQANDYVIIDAVIEVRTITASGTVIADGTITYTIAASVTNTSFTVASTTLDSTVVEAVVIKSLASATSLSNQVRLDELSIDLFRTTGVQAIVIADEAINNSSGTGSSPVSGFNSAAFIRCMVP
jgi:hypothetical protein